MKIIILGAGQVGETVATSLAIENNDITIVDIDAEVLKSLAERLDVRTIVGMGAHPEVLIQAGIEDADMLIALTSSDETNMIACQIAYTLFRTPTKIARIRASQYMLRKELFNNNALPVDVIISPENLVTNHIYKLIQHPNALQVLDFADGRLQLVAVKASAGGSLINQQLKTLTETLPKIKARIVVIYRENQVIFPDAETVIREDDEVFFIAEPENIISVISELRTLDKPNKKIIIAGGGNIGLKLAKSLEIKYNVKVIERNPKRIPILSLNLNHAIVLKGDSSDRELLLDENIDTTDVFCSITNHDEANVMSAILAKRLGAKKVMALVRKSAYIDLVEGGEIDVAISPKLTTIGSLLAHIRRGDVVKVHSLRRGVAEAIEAIAHGTEKSSQVIGREIKQLKLPPGSTIPALVRQDKVIFTDAQTIIEAEDHIIIFLSDKRYIHQVEKLFQVGLSYF